MKESHPSQRRIDRWIGPAIFVSAFVLYLVTSHGLAGPGEAVRAAVRHSPNNPFVAFNHQLWESVSGMFVLVPIGTLVFRLSLFSALCATGTLVLLWIVQRQLPFRDVDAEKQRPGAIERAKTVSAATATGFLAVLLPFWMVANRPQPLSFDALLFMTATALVVLFCRTGRPMALYWAAFACGVAGVEHPGFVIASPLLGFSLLLGVLQYSEVRAREIVIAVFSFLGGCMVLPLSALWVLRQPAADYQGLEGFRMVVALMGREHLGMILRSMPKTGWLLVGMTSFLPWLLLFPQTMMGDQRAVRVKASTVLLHGTLGLIAVGLLWNLDFAPWKIPELRGALVLPCIFVASWVGYLVGHWYLVMGRTLSKRGAESSKLRIARTALVGGVALLIVAGGVHNYRSADAGRESYLSECAELLVADIQPDAWVYGYGSFLYHVWLAANEADKPIQTVDMALSTSEPYVRYLASLSDDTQVEYAASIGAEAFLRNMMKEREQVERTAVIFSGDMLTSAGYEPIPQGLFYRARLPDEELDPEALVTEARDRWAKAMAVIDAAPVDGVWLPYVRMLLSQSANNLGVLLQDLGDDVGGIEAYEQARTFKTDNISALLNLYGTTKRMASVQFAAYETELNELIARQGGLGGDVWSLATRDGYVRSPLIFRDMGLSWALSGQRAKAVQALERAEELGARGGGVRNTLGALYMFDQDWERSAEQFQIVLDSRPEHIGALIGMGRLSVLQGDFASASQYLRRAEEAGSEFQVIGPEMALLRIAEGQEDLGAEILKKLMEEDSDQTKPLLILANLRIRQGLTEEARTLLAEPALRDATRPAVLRTVGNQWEALGDRETARSVLRRALLANELDPATLEQLAQLDLREGLLDDAERHAKTLLTLDPENTVANYIFGLANHVRGNLTVAEQCYRTSLKDIREVETLNNLAVLLAAKGELEEALSLADEATTVRPDYASAWDTLGFCLLQSDQLSEARMALEQALQLEPDKPASALNLLDVLVREGDRESITALMESLGTLELTDEQGARFDALRAQVK